MTTATRTVDTLNERDARLFREVLLAEFPWLKTDESVSGADVVDQLLDILDSLEVINSRNC